MRTQAERARQPNQLPAGTEYVVLDILKDSSQAGAAQLLAVLGDPKAAEAMLGGGKAVALFEESYRELVSLPSAGGLPAVLLRHRPGRAHPGGVSLHHRQGQGRLATLRRKLFLAWCTNSGFRELVDGAGPSARPLMT